VRTPHLSGILRENRVAGSPVNVTALYTP
jgi:hypothetical protein